jgi:hypothetical protein
MLFQLQAANKCDKLPQNEYAYQSSKFDNPGSDLGPFSGFNEPVALVGAFE